jgi:hypothetical protein
MAVSYLYMIVFSKGGDDGVEATDLLSPPSEGRRFAGLVVVRARVVWETL